MLLSLKEENFCIAVKLDYREDPQIFHKETLTSSYLIVVLLYRPIDEAYHSSDSPHNTVIICLRLVVIK